MTIFFKNTKKRPHTGAFFYLILDSLFDLGDDGVKSRWVLFGDLGHNFAVEGHIGFFHSANELAVADLVFGESGAELDVPEGTSCAFLDPTITTGVGAGFDDGGLGALDQVLAAPFEALGFFQ